MIRAPRWLDVEALATNAADAAAYVVIRASTLCASMPRLPALFTATSVLYTRGVTVTGGAALVGGLMCVLPAARVKSRPKICGGSGRRVTPLRCASALPRRSGRRHVARRSPLPILPSAMLRKHACCKRPGSLPVARQDTRAQGSGVGVARCSSIQPLFIDAVYALCNSGEAPCRYHADASPRFT